MKFISKYSSYLNSKEKTEIANIYIEAFSSPPRNEKIVFNEIIKSLFENDTFYTLAIEDNSIIGFISSYDIIFFSDKEKLSLDDDNAKYISAFAVSKRNRSGGLGKDLLTSHISTLDNKNIYTRTRTDMDVINHLLQKYDFIIINEYSAVTNGVTSDRYIHKRSSK